ncbi:MAG: discoidin domain-containing protein [bacterium]
MKAHHLLILSLFIAVHPLRAESVSVSASSSEIASAFPPANAADGNPATRWSSRFNDDEWLIVDYGKQRDLVGLSLHWEAANAQKYAVEVSSNGRTWRTVYREDAGHGGVEDIYFGRQRCRYLKLKFLQRATAWGYSLWEILPKGVDEELRLTASSAAPGTEAGKILDGDPATYWKPASDGAAWVALSFPGDRLIAGVGVEGVDAPEQSWNLEISKDGTNWIQTGAWSRQAERSVCLIGKAAVRHVRLVRHAGTEGLGEVCVLDWANVASESALEIVRGLAGMEGSPTKIHVGRDGSFVAEPHNGQIGVAAYDPDADILYTPETMVTDWSLEDGRLPFNDIRWRAGGLTADTVIFAENYNGHELTYARSVLSNATDRARRVTMLVTVRPSSINAERAKALHNVARPAQDRLVMDGAGLVRVQWPDGQEPSTAGELSALGIHLLATTDNMDVRSPNDCGAAGRDVELGPGEAVACTVWVPSGPVDAQFEFPDVEARHRALRDAWRARAPIVLKVPDKRYEDFSTHPSTTSCCCPRRTRSGLDR